MLLPKILTILTFASFGQCVVDYLAEIKFSLREERIPAILNYLLNNSLETHQITTQDIVQLSKLDKSDLDQTVHTFNYFNLTPGEVFTVNHLENLLDSIDLEFPDFYRDLISKLGLGTSRTGQVLEDLQIPALDFLLTSTQGGYVFDILRQGKYSEENVNKALATAEKTSNEVYVVARDIIKDKVLQMSAPKFMEVLKEYGWSKQMSVKLYNALNITTADVYGVEKFRNIFTNITDFLNQNQTVGVFIANNKVAIHKFVYDRAFKHVDGTTIKAEANGLEVNPRVNQYLGENIVEVATKSTGFGYIEIVDFYNSTENCSYVTINDGQVSVESVLVQDLTVKKSDRTKFSLGSPLVCDGFLYGLAREESQEEIIFDAFYTSDNPPPAPEVANSGHFATPLSFAFNLFICLLMLK